MTPINRRRPIALKRKPSTIMPEADGSAPFNYPTLVQPVLDKHCLKCHDVGGKEPLLTGRLDGKKWSPSYRSLQPYTFYYDGDAGQFTESKTYPGKFGAKVSKLYQMLLKGHNKVSLTPAEMRRITLWLDCNSDFYGTYEYLDKQQHGEKVYPILE